MDYNTNEIKTGLMIVASVAIFMIFLFAIFGIDFGDNMKEYHTYLQYIGGISIGSVVKYGGMDVGYVTEMALPENNRTKITLKIKIDDKTPVKVDSKAYVTSVGIMTNPHIEISSGSHDANYLRPGSLLDSKEVLSFTQMAEPFGEISAQVQELVNRTIEVFSVENQAHLSSILANTDSLITDGQKELLNIVKNLENLTGHLANLSGDMNEMVSNNKVNFDETIIQLEKTAKETGQLISDFRTTLSILDNMMTSNSTNIVEIMENFQFASQNLEEFTRIVKERPWLLVRKVAQPERKIP